MSRDKRYKQWLEMFHHEQFDHAEDLRKQLIVARFLFIVMTTMFLYYHYLLTN